MPSQYQIAFWNLENLFDVEDSPRRTEKLQRAIGEDIRGWTQVELDQKIRQLAKIISQLNGGKGPDLLGVCEVENAYVIDLLVNALQPLGRRYAVEHHDMSDGRGIDVGLVYDADRFRVEGQFSHFVMRRNATRDLFQVNFKTQKNRLLVVVGNHWPARLGGEAESACYRAIAGETLAYFHERILEVQGNDAAVLALGDFNDEPFDQSLVNYALSNRSRSKVIKARNAQFLNLMWPLLGQGLGTHYYNNDPNFLDQFLVNKNLLTAQSPLKVVLESVAIARFPEMVDPGEYPKPIRFGGMGKAVNPRGFSDHFPITVNLVEAD